MNHRDLVLTLRVVLAAILAALPLEAAQPDTGEGQQRPNGPKIVLVQDVKAYVRNSSAPARKGVIRFAGCTVEKVGTRWCVNASYWYSVNGFRLGYTLKGTLKDPKEARKIISATDLVDVVVEYKDVLTDAESLTEADIPTLIRQLYQAESKAQWNPGAIPGGDFIHFSMPMLKLMLLGSKARAHLVAKLGDERIRNEVALVLGAVGDEATVPLLIRWYPALDLRAIQEDSVEYMEAQDKIASFTYALVYLTGQPIGRDRDGTDYHPVNKKKWADWWNLNHKQFRVLSVKPNQAWMPRYPILTKESRAEATRIFVEGDQ